MSTLTPNMAIAVPGAISGTDIIDDLCTRIAGRLALTNDLRSVDCYRGYTAKVVIDLQLIDLDTVENHAELQVGSSIDPQRPAQHMTVSLGARAEDLGLEPQSLEKPIDAEGFTPEKRMYVSRIRGAK